MKPVDPLFAQYIEKHKTVAYSVLGFAIVTHSKVTRMYFSYFLSFDMFKARFSKAALLMRSAWWSNRVCLCLIDLPILITAGIGLATV